MEIQKIADVLKLLSKKGSRRHRTAAVILAAGEGHRFGESVVRKQHFSIAGIPTVVRSLLAFENCDVIDEIVVVAASGEEFYYDSYRLKYGISKLKCTVKGGATRQDSALAGFDALDPKTEFVAIHDAARCLVTPEIIEKTVREAYMTGAAIAAEPSIDTVKIAAADGTVESTPERATVWCAKTPQVFMANMYRAAAYSAKQENAAVTDDSSLCERLGFKVKLVDCGHENIKITTQEDVLIAENLLALRGDCKLPEADGNK